MILDLIAIIFDLLTLSTGSRKKKIICGSCKTTVMKCKKPSDQFVRVDVRCPKCDVTISKGW